MSISTTTAYCKRSLITCNNPMGRIELKKLRRRPMSMVPNSKYRKVSIPSLTGAFLYCRFGRRAEPTGKLRLSDTKRHPLAICWRLRGRKNHEITKDHMIYSRFYRLFWRTYSHFICWLNLLLSVLRVIALSKGAGLTPSGN